MKNKMSFKLEGLYINESISVSNLHLGVKTGQIFSTILTRRI